MRQRGIEEALQRRCRLSRLTLWKLLLTTVLLVGTNTAFGQRQEVEIRAENANHFQDLLAGAEPGTTFVLAAEVELSATVSIESANVTIRGSSSEARSVVRCDEGVDMAFRVSSDGVEFADLEIRDCRGTAISVSSVASDNSFYQQGLPGPVPLRVEFRDVYFVNNGGSQDANSAGALFIGRRVTAEVVRCTFENNTAPIGGAIRSLGTSLQISNSSFNRNTAHNSGGAIRGSAHPEDLRDPEQQRTLSIRNTQFLQNRVLQGGEDPNPLTVESSAVDVEANQYLKFPRPTSSGGALNLADFASVTITRSEFEGNSAVPAGGAIYLSDNGETEIRNCAFRDNFVSPVAQQRNDAQGLQVGGAMFVAFRDPSSRLEIEISVFVNNSAVYGGALHVVAPVSSTVIVTEGEFIDNRARLGGGAIIFRNVDSPELSGCRFVRNSAFVGGAVFVTNGAGLQVKRGGEEPRPNFTNNIALDGGAVFGIGTGTVKLADIELIRNQAYRHGGALCLVDSKAGGEFTLQDGRLSDNTAEIGGALYLENTERVDILATSDEATRNPLDHEEMSDGVNTFSGNAAVAGGAVYYRASNPVRNTVDLVISRFVNNSAYSNLSAIYPEPLDYPGRNEEESGSFGRRLMQGSKNEVPSDESLLDPLGAEPCYPGGGGAVCFVLTGLSQRVSATIQLLDSSFESNSASVGGGLYLSTEEGVDWASECQSVDESTSALLVNDPCRILRLRDLVFVDNSARLAGGGLFVSNLTHVHYSSAETEISDEPYIPLVDSPYIQELTSNSVEDGGYGPNIASMAVSLRIKYPTPDPETGLLITNHSSGQSNPLRTIRVEIVDQVDQVVSAGIADSILRVHANAESYETKRSIVSGQIDAVAQAGVADFSALAILARAGIYELEFEPPKRSIKGITSSVEIRVCVLGEVDNKNSFVCEVCGFEYFSFDTTKRHCDACPVHGRCRGGASIVPSPNYWHSSPFSTVMLECFSSKACRYDHRTSTLEHQHSTNRQEFLDRLQNSTEEAVFTNEEYSQCAEGYEGPLCGSCDDGYGRTDSKTCRKCGSKRLTLIVVLGVSLWQLVLVGVTLRSALVSIKEMNDVLLFVGNSSTLFAPPTGSTVRIGSNAGAQGLAHLRDIMNDPENAGLTSEELHERYEEMRQQPIPPLAKLPNPATTAKQAYAVEYIEAIQHVSETIKIFVNFLQMTSVAISINVDWTETVRQMLATMKSIAGLSSGASFTPLTCLLDDTTNNRSIYGEMLRFSIPLGIILFFVIYYSIRWFFMMRRDSATREQCMEFLKSRVIISSLVVMFFTYQSLSEGFMGMVSYIELDSHEINADNLYREYSIATDRYWTVDTNIKYFERRHAFLAVCLGIPGIIFFLIGVPICLLSFLLYRRGKGMLLDTNMVNTYGFIYQNYRKTFVFWEVCILARKALIGAVVVFAYPLGSNLQGVMALGILIFALSIHLIAGPFKYDVLNILEGLSLVVSIFTFYSGIVFNDENTTHVGSVFLSTVLVFVNVVLVFVLLVSVVRYGDKFATSKLKFLGFQDIPQNLIVRAIKLVKEVSGQALMSLRHTVGNRLFSSEAGANGNQTAARTRTSDANQPSTSQAPAQFSNVVQEGNAETEITVELP